MKNNKKLNEIQNTADTVHSNVIENCLFDHEKNASYVY